jgi:hypothetical protein
MEETDQTKKLIDSNDIEEIESRGILIRQAEFYKKEMTVFGRYQLIFKRSNYY